MQTKGIKRKTFLVSWRSHGFFAVERIFSASTQNSKKLEQSSLLSGKYNHQTLSSFDLRVSTKCIFYTFLLVEGEEGVCLYRETHASHHNKHCISKNKQILSSSCSCLILFFSLKHVYTIQVCKREREIDGRRKYHENEMMIQNRRLCFFLLLKLIAAN